jgi:hypothetical protein
MKEATNMRISDLSALGLNVLSPLEQEHLLGGSNLTVQQVREVRQIVQQVQQVGLTEDDFLDI